MVVATHSRGIFSANILSANDLFTIDDLKKNVPVVTLYPNPTSTISVLEIEMKQSVTARIELFDIAGRKVLSIFNGIFSAGKNNFHLNVQSLPSGIYFCKISSEYFEKVVEVSVVRQ